MQAVATQRIVFTVLSFLGDSRGRTRHGDPGTRERTEKEPLFFSGAIVKQKLALLLTHFLPREEKKSTQIPHEFRAFRRKYVHALIKGFTAKN